MGLARGLPLNTIYYWRVLIDNFQVSEVLRCKSLIIQRV